MSDNTTITELIKYKKYPKNPLIPLDKAFLDERGMIQNLITNGIESVAVITSKQGVERSNHFHLYNAHFLYIISGSIKYYERDLDGSNVIIEEYGAGQMFFTPPNKVHKVEFLTDTIMVSLAPASNAPAAHDQDTIHQIF